MKFQLASFCVEFSCQYHILAFSGLAATRNGKLQRNSSVESLSLELKMLTLETC